MDRVVYVAETCPSGDPWRTPCFDLSDDQKTFYWTLHTACCWVAVALWREFNPNHPSHPRYPELRTVWSDNPEDMVVRVNFRTTSHLGIDLLASFNRDALTEAVYATQVAFGGELRRLVVKRPEVISGFSL